MTNTYFDQGKGSPYRGGFVVCPDCAAVVAQLHRQKHETWHDEHDEGIDVIDLVGEDGNELVAENGAVTPWDAR